MNIIYNSMHNGYNLSLKLAMVLSATLILSGVPVMAAEQKRYLPADNDETYKLPVYVPQAALPKNAAPVVFDDKKLDNDELYTIPKNGAVATKQAAAPAAKNQKAVPAAATENYQKQYEEYQKQLDVYNKQMVEYKRQLQQRQQDNDSAYSLPGQYSPARNQQPTVAPATHPAQQYNQQYNYSDQVPVPTNKSTYAPYPSYY